MLRYAITVFATSMLIACGGQNNAYDYASGNSYDQPEPESQQVIYCDCTPYSDVLAQTTSAQYIAGYSLVYNANESNQQLDMNSISDLENGLLIAKSLGREAILKIKLNGEELPVNNVSPSLIQRYVARVDQLGRLLKDKDAISTIHLPFPFLSNKREIEALLSGDSLPTIIAAYEESFPAARLNISLSIDLPSDYIQMVKNALESNSPDRFHIRLVLDGTADDVAEYVNILMNNAQFPNASNLTVTKGFYRRLNSTQRVDILAAVIYRAWKDGITAVELPEEAIGSNPINEAIEHQSRLSSITSLAH